MKHGILLAVLMAILFLCITGNAAKWTCVQRWLATCHTWRMEVPGGWVVSGEGYDDGEYAMAFVPDPQHSWKD